MKQFNVPSSYRSEILGPIKSYRKKLDPRKKDFSPSVLKLKGTEIVIPRHFGFCYGVENAIEIAFETIHKNVGKRIFMLGEMIHNPDVNRDLVELGVKFLVNNAGERLIDFSTLTSSDVVITPAFGTTVEIEKELNEIGVELEKYNTTCPFVEKVWNRSSELGNKNYTLVIHGKYKHEETRATFSHGAQSGHCIIIRNIEEARELADFINQTRSQVEFEKIFAGKFTKGMKIAYDLKRIGVVNQTTMLAEETIAISNYLRDVVVGVHGPEAYADTRDTLCYATNDNQTATQHLLNNEGVKIAFVVGGFNSSNTLQLATILKKNYLVFYIRGESDIIDKNIIRHFNFENMSEELTQVDWLSEDFKKFIITSGASCPDSIMDSVIRRIADCRNSLDSLDLSVKNLLAEE